MSILKDRDFRGLFLADTASQLGTQVLVLAIPLAAVQSLNASEFEVGLLAALQTAAFLLIGLPAGAIVDRQRKRNVMIVADWGRALTLASVPLAWWFDVLTMGHLYAVAVIMGLFTVFFDVAYQSYLPYLLDRDKLVRGNSALEVVRTVSQLGGPPVSGWLIQWLTAPFALLTTVVGFAWSALCLGTIRKREQRQPRSEDRHLGREIMEGLRFVLGHRLLRRIAGSTGTFNLFWSMANPMIILLLARDLELSAGVIGLLTAVGGLGGLVGAAVASKFAAKVGQGPAIWMSTALSAPFGFLLPIVEADWRLGLVVVQEFMFGLGVVLYNVTQLSFRQAITPEPLLGRMNATMRFLVWGTMPIGGIIGGVLGEVIGVRNTLWICAAGATLSFLWIYTSPMRTMRELPVSNHTPQ
ncbi:MFS transporter [Nonomuraea soli]|uniref:MFS family permease n=1 Tax=Nonomuraea soli TaxID=1032476 RepID=A0A7W0CNH6_9ACTN|nr:MFS transporter [Nonomuraea soli]MBA2894426.1 MFS family permease [Nonomuraea soli]